MNNQAERMTLLLNMKPNIKVCNLFNDYFKYKQSEPDELFICKICERGFSFCHNLKSHLKSGYHKRQLCDYKECVFTDYKLYCNVCINKFDI